jgi:hypothetical protein
MELVELSSTTIRKNTMTEPSQIDSCHELPHDLLVECLSYWTQQQVFETAISLQNKQLLQYIVAGNMFHTLEFHLDKDINNDYVHTIGRLYKFMQNVDSITTETSCPVSFVFHFSCTRVPSAIAKYSMSLVNIVSNLRRVIGIKYVCNPKVERDIFPPIFERLYQMPNVCETLESLDAVISDPKRNLHSDYVSDSISPERLRSKLINFPSLKHWGFSDVFGAFVGAKGYIHAVFNNLNSISFNNGFDINPSDLIHNRVNLKAIQSQIQTLKMVNLTERWPSLSNIGGCVQFENIRELVITNCISVDTELVTQLVTKCTGLKRFEYFSDLSASYSQLFKFTDNYKNNNLTELSLYYPNTTFQLIQTIVERFPSIQKLAIHRSKEFHIDPMDTILKLSGLVDLDLTLTPAIGLESIASALLNHTSRFQQMKRLGIHMVRVDEIVLQSCLALFSKLTRFSNLDTIYMKGPGVSSPKARQIIRSNIQSHFPRVKLQLDRSNLSEDVIQTQESDLWNSPLCNNYLEERCNCEKITCYCGMESPICSTIDHKSLCVERRKVGDYDMVCPLCIDVSIRRADYANHMAEYHEECVGVNNRIGKRDNIFWPCPLAGCPDSICVNVEPQDTLLLRLRQSKLHHLAKCQANVIHDLYTDEFISFQDHQIRYSDMEEEQKKELRERLMNRIATLYPDFHEVLINALRQYTIPVSSVNDRGRIYIGPMN